jgi:hypothetical protein
MDRRPKASGPAAVTVVVEAAATDVRRTVGPTAWCALEVLAATPSDDGEVWVVWSSVRDVASHLGIAANTAQRALRVLRDRGLITVIQDREHGGRFGSTAYALTVDPCVLSRPPLATLRDAIAATLATRVRTPRPSTPECGEQLALLPSD